MKNLKKLQASKSKLNNFKGANVLSPQSLNKVVGKGIDDDADDTSIVIIWPTVN